MVIWCDRICLTIIQFHNAIHNVIFTQENKSLRFYSNVRMLKRSIVQYVLFMLAEETERYTTQIFLWMIFQFKDSLLMERSFILMKWPIWVVPKRDYETIINLRKTVFVYLHFYVNYDKNLTFKVVFLNVYKIYFSLIALMERYLF